VRRLVEERPPDAASDEVRLHEEVSQLQAWRLTGERGEACDRAIPLGDEDASGADELVLDGEIRPARFEKRFVVAPDRF
jgi:hypothetical protein